MENFGGGGGGGGCESRLLKECHCGLLVLACFLSFVIFCLAERFHMDK